MRNKIGLVIQREYLVRVKKKSFVYTTLLVPIVIVAFYGIFIAIAMSGSHEKNRIAVIDEANLFNGKVDGGANTKYEFITDRSLDSLKASYKKQGYNYILHVPPMNVDSPKTVQVYSAAPVGLSQMGSIEKRLNKAVELKRLQSSNITPEQYNAIKADVDLDNKLINGKEEKDSAGGVAHALAYVCGILIYITLLIYGTMVMRGVMEEKINRIAEVIVSSVKPFQLMLGKIIGIGAVGLTQFAIWIIFMALLSLLIPLFMPGVDPNVMAEAANASDKMNMMNTLRQGLHTIPWGLVTFCFIFYFLGGYLLYASLFAAIGSVVSDDQQESQQMVFPIMTPIILAFVILTRTVAEPNSSLAVFGSLFPLTSPVVMMGRIMFDVPVSQIILSIVLLILNIFFFAWLTGKIYRTGILLYGKKTTWKEMVKWAFRKS
jgi:ABC-2 type transport system permease protein